MSLTPTVSPSVLLIVSKKKNDSLPFLLIIVVLVGIVFMLVVVIAYKYFSPTPLPLMTGDIVVWKTKNIIGTITSFDRGTKEYEVMFQGYVKNVYFKSSDIRRATKQDIQEHSERLRNEEMCNVFKAQFRNKSGSQNLDDQHIRVVLDKVGDNDSSNKDNNYIVDDVSVTQEEIQTPQQIIHHQNANDDQSKEISYHIVSRGSKPSSPQSQPPRPSFSQDDVRVDSKAVTSEVPLSSSHAVIDENRDVDKDIPPTSVHNEVGESRTINSIASSSIRMKPSSSYSKDDKRSGVGRAQGGDDGPTTTPPRETRQRQPVLPKQRGKGKGVSSSRSIRSPDRFQEEVPSISSPKLKSKSLKLALDHTPDRGKGRKI